MIIKGDKATTFCTRPPPDIFIFLLFGQDEGVVADHAKILANAIASAAGEETPISRLHEDELKKDPVVLPELLSARALLGGRDMYRLKINGDALAKQFDSLLSSLSNKAMYAENYLIVEAGDLQKKSKIRDIFNISQSAAVLQFRADNDQQTAAYIREQLSGQNILIDEDALEFFSSELPGDRRLANSEIEKMCLYAYQLDRPLSMEDVRQVATAEQPRGSDDAADAAILGRAAKAIHAIDRFLDAGGSPVSALRTLHYRILRIADAKSGARYLRPPVPPADQSSFTAGLSHWNTKRITRALAMLYGAEKTCKQGGAPAEAALKIVLDRIARRAV